MRRRWKWREYLTAWQRSSCGEEIWRRRAMARLPPPGLAGSGGVVSAAPLRDLVGVAGDGGPLVCRATSSPSAAAAGGVGPAMRDLNFCTAPSTENSTTPITTTKIYKKKQKTLEEPRLGSRPPRLKSLTGDDDEGGGGYMYRVRFG